MTSDSERPRSSLDQNRAEQTEALKSVIYCLKLDLGRGKKNLSDHTKGRSLQTCMDLFRATR